ncbi:MAG: hypothetical protein U0441_36470 [Polyangiaceae bacterium]
MSRSVWWPVGMSAALLLAAASGCELILPFDEGKLTGGTGGAATTAGGVGGQATMTCDGCCTAADCPAPSDPCTVATCEANVCGSKTAEDGTAAATQTPGDCKKSICMGGQAMNELDTTDALDDGNVCTVDWCAEDGSPQAIPGAAGSNCSFGGGSVCDGAGNCVECLVAGDCKDPAKPLCDSATHSCISAQCGDGMQNGTETDIDCGGANCPKCGVGKECAGLGSNCMSNFCDANSKCAATDPNGTPCMSGAACVSGYCADMVCCASPCQGMCRACNLAGSMGTCTNIPAGQDPANECAGAGLCDGSGMCGLPNGTGCTAASDCISAICADGVCCNSSCAGSCKACNLVGSMGTCANIPLGQDPANECASSSCNGNGACNKPLGQNCGNAGECDSGFCTDGVCCADDCQGLCKACNVAGSLGSCTFVPNGTDPASECNGANNNCNGAGACTM